MNEAKLSGLHGAKIPKHRVNTLEIEVIIRAVMMIEDVKGLAGQPHDRFWD